MRNKTPFIQCPKCRGSRVILLPIRLEDALAEVRHTPGLTIPELLDRFPGIGQAAVNKRLTELLELGLVRRTQASHSWKWYPNK